jgi:hypothetical protein
MSSNSCTSQCATYPPVVSSALDRLELASQEAQPGTAFSSWISSGRRERIHNKNWQMHENQEQTGQRADGSASRRRCPTARVSRRFGSSVEGRTLVDTVKQLSLGEKPTALAAVPMRLRCALAIRRRPVRDMCQRRRLRVSGWLPARFSATIATFSRSGSGLPQQEPRRRFSQPKLPLRFDCFPHLRG